MTKHVVQSGETLGAIAQKYYGKASAYVKIAAFNNIENPNVISVGTELEIPDAEPSTEPSSEIAEPTTANIEATGDVTNLSTSQLATIIGNDDIAQQYAEALNRCFSQYGINTPLRIAHFMAQICHESGNFKFTVENLNYSAKALRGVFGKYFPDDEIAEQYARQPEKIANRVYADRMGNGNESSGEGWAYRGRGLIQLTGKENYQKFAQSSDIDVVNNPNQVSDDPELCVAAAGWYWQERNLNEHADNDDINSITRRINGGLNGLEDRQSKLDNAKELFGIG